MTKEELEKEATEWAKDHHYYNGTIKGYVAERDSVINAYLAGAEPREKQIEIDAKQIIALQQQKGELTDNLTRAKEHIRTLISCLIDWVQEGDKDYCYIAEAEQFISEVEK